MPRTGAHGGNTALRDAALLAETLISAADGGPPVEEAIQRYQRQMIEYSFKDVDASTSMLSRMQLKNPVTRYFILRTIPAMRSLIGASSSLD